MEHKTHVEKCIESYQSYHHNSGAPADSHGSKQFTTSPSFFGSTVADIPDF